MLRRSLLSLALIASAFSSSGAQSLAQLPRATVATGMNDSTLVYVSDSAKRSRAAVAPDFRKMLSLRAFDSLAAAGLRITGTTTLNNLTVNGTCTNCGGVTYPLAATNGSAAAPSISFANSTGLGFYRFGADTLGIASGGVHSLDISGGAASKIRGGAGNMTIQCGTGNSRTCTFQPTNGSGTPTTALTLTSSGAQMTWLPSSGSGGLTLTSDGGGSGSMTLTSTFGTRLYISPNASQGLAGVTLRYVNSSFQTNDALTVDASNNGSITIASTLSGTILTGSTALRGGNGSVTAPSHSFTSSTQSGLYVIDNGSSDTLGVATNGAASLKIIGNRLIGGIASNDSLNIQASVAAATGTAITLSGSNGSGTIERWAKLMSNGTANGQLYMLNNTSSCAGSGQPSYSFIGDADTGMCSSGANTLGFVTGAKRTLTLQGSDSSATFLGKLFAGDTIFMRSSAGTRLGGLFYSGGTWLSALNTSDNLIFGVNNNGIMRFNVGAGDAGQINKGGQFRFGNLAATRTAGTPAISFMTDTTTGIYYTGSAAAGDTVWVSTSATARLGIADNAATGAGDEALCITTSGVAKVMTQGATCGTSSAKAKTAFGSIFNPTEKTMALRPTGYSYIPGLYGERHEYGMTAEATAAVDSTLVFRAPADQVLPNGQTIRKGEPLNVNDRAVLALLTATVQEVVATSRRQQATIDSLRLELAKVKKP